LPPKNSQETKYIRIFARINGGGGQIMWSLELLVPSFPRFYPHRFKYIKENILVCGILNHKNRVGKINKQYIIIGFRTNYALQ
jgi:hypothetical protein